MAVGGGIVGAVGTDENLAVLIGKEGEAAGALAGRAGAGAGPFADEEGERGEAVGGASGLRQRDNQGEQYRRTAGERHR